METAPHPWLVVDIASSIPPGSAIPGIVTTNYGGSVAGIDKQIVVLNIVLAHSNAAMSTTIVKTINLFPSVGFMSSKSAKM